MSNHAFSIILPTYNRANMLDHSINSVIKQTYINWELLVIDDGSTDNTKEIVLNYKDKRIKYFYQDNQERSVARNHGIDLASGIYICFLDSDDLYEANHLEVLNSYVSLNNHPKELIFTNCYYLKEYKKDKPTLPIASGDPIKYLLQASVIPARTCIHREILEKHKFPEDINIGEDAYLWVTIACDFGIKHLQDYTIIYRIHEENTVNIKNNVFLYRLRGLKKLFKNPIIRTKTGRKTRRIVFNNCYLGIYRHYEFKKNKVKMIGCLTKAIFLYPEIKLKLKTYLLLSVLPITSYIIKIKESK